MKVCHRICTIAAIGLAAQALPAIAHVWPAPSHLAPRPAKNAKAHLVKVGLKPGLPTPTPYRILGICSYPDAYALAFSHDGALFAAGNGDASSTSSLGEIRIWNVKTGEVFRSIICTHPVFAIAFSPDDKQIAVSTVDSSVSILNIATGMLIHKIVHPHASWGLCLAYSPDGKLLATGSGDMPDNQWPGEVRFWDTVAWKPHGIISKPEQAVFGLTFSPDSRVCALASHGTKAGAHAGVMETWNAATLRRMWSRPDPDILSVSFLSPTTLAGISAPAAAPNSLDVKLFGPKAGVAQKTLRLRMGTWAFSPEGKWLAGTGQSGHVVEVRDAHTGKLSNTLVGRPGARLAYAFSPKESMLATGDQNGTVILWPHPTVRTNVTAGKLKTKAR